MAITFDDLPAHGDLPPGQSRLDVATSILKTLAAARMPEVYGFINAGKLESHPEDISVLRAWRAAGEPLGNHTWSHMDLNKHSVEEYEADIVKNESPLASLMGNENWHWFRYPFLWEGDTLVKRHAIREFIRTRNYRIAQVTMDFEDYLWNAPYARCVAKDDHKSIAWLRSTYLSTADQYLSLYRDISRTLYGRDIRYVLLLHVGAFDARMLPDLLALYKSRGFNFITLRDAQQDPAYAGDPDLPLKYGGTLLEQMMAARRLKIPDNTKPYRELDAACR